MRYGYFDDKNKEYVIERPDVPVSWTNYLGLKDTCGIISHNAGGYNFYKSSGQGRFTRFRANAIPLDRPGRYVYLRDDDTGEYWSISWQPVGKDLSKAKYQARHGLSYSRFFCNYLNIEAEETVFIPLDENLEVWSVKIKNNGNKPRKISVFSYLEFAFLWLILDNYYFQYSLYASTNTCKDGIIDYKFIDFDHHFFASSFTPDSFDADRESFIGPYRTETNPIAVEQGVCSNTALIGGNPCGSLHKRLTLKSGQEVRLAFIVGVGAGSKEGKKAKEKYSKSVNVDKELEYLYKYWDEKLSIYQCRTPDPGLNSFANIWNIYQVETCVTWSRFASFVEVGGRVGLGYRDTSQDVMAVVHTNPGKARQRICELLTAQVSDGYAIHLFDPLTLKPGKEEPPALDQVCSDDMLWLIVTVCEFVKETGDISFFDKVLPFADKGKATVYEHLKRALNFSEKQVGKHGICVGLKADWNDCINLRGGGESSMVSFQYYWALQSFIEAAEYLGRINDIKKYKCIADTVRDAVNEHLWDGEWYVRAITSKGVRVGSKKNKEGKIYLNAQTWAVFSGLAQGDRALKSMDSVNKYLYSKYGLHIQFPAYTKEDPDIGFITRVARGLKENASIFSHPNPWAVIAECLLGRGDRAYKFYSAILPYNQNDRIEIREAEPYSYCQFVVGKDHTQFGRARHPWLTGSAGWFYTAVTRYILGFRPGYDGFIVDPCIPAKWKEFSLTRKFRGATYQIEVKNPSEVQKGVKEVILNGKPTAFPIKPQKKGTVNKLKIVMG